MYRRWRSARSADKKGGHLARRKADGRFILRESAMCPDDDKPKFEDVHAAQVLQHQQPVGAACPSCRRAPPCPRPPVLLQRAGMSVPHMLLDVCTPGRARKAHRH